MVTDGGAIAVANRIRAKGAAYASAGAAVQARADEVKEIYSVVVDLVVYLEHPPGADDGPKKYRRTYNLLRSVSARFVMEEEGAVGVQIYFDPNISRAWDGFGSYSVYVPLSEGFLRKTRHWTSEWRERAYNEVLRFVNDIVRAAIGVA